VVWQSHQQLVDEERREESYPLGRSLQVRVGCFSMCFFEGPWPSTQKKEQKVGGGVEGCRPYIIVLDNL
jgi:hypothetical protein